MAKNKAKLPTGFKAKAKAKAKAKSKTKIKTPPTAPRLVAPPVDIHSCSGRDDLEFYLIEVKSAKDKSPAFSFQFWSGPKKVTLTTRSVLTDPKIQGSVGQNPLAFQYLDNVKVLLSDFIFDGKTRNILPGDKIEALRQMQRPNARGALRVFELIIKSGTQATRSYGYFVVQLGVITELLRDKASGNVLRFSVDIELTGVAQYQLDLGQDLAIPKELVPTVPTAGGASAAGVASSGSAAAEVEGAFPIGTKIANTGNSGSSTGPHLHWIWVPLSVGANFPAVKEYYRKNYTGNKRLPDFAAKAVLAGGKPLSQGVTSIPGPRQSFKTSGGQRSTSFHVGQDVALPIGTPLTLAQPMSFVRREESGNRGYGTLLIMRCDAVGHEGFYFFAHLNTIEPAVIKAKPVGSSVKSSKDAPTVPGALGKALVDNLVN